eukprot:TRINITY_DN46493_c0_g1_i1.p1 TRINITY_DN46493_c0_g1~~TRINITY_DN46493_c0_g1_i1.p1  ORF type:complete len:665 (+),score=86.08 TRINITY_DN46493_c0_g1_i1:48-1997(+)
MGCGKSRDPGDGKCKEVARKPCATKSTEGAILQKYVMVRTKENILGEGSFSICYRGKPVGGGADVAIKYYKGSDKDEESGTMEMRFRRQIDVLRSLAEPFKEPLSTEHWHQKLGKMSTDELFMRLLDFSKDASGKPALDPRDGLYYIVTEMAQYSLKDLLDRMKAYKESFSPDNLQALSDNILCAVAALHAKGLAHLDLKPANLMFFGDNIKVIDVDGCVEIGKRIILGDASVAFSLCYCAPEWATFLMSDVGQIEACPSLDAWSVGMTLCELVIFSAVLRPVFASFVRNAQKKEDASFLFVEWLASLKKVAVPSIISRTNPSFAQFVAESLLVPDASKRKSCAASLSMPYFGSMKQRKSQVSPKVEKTALKHPERSEDESTEAPVYQGTLWKLKTNADPTKEGSWDKRDMWISGDHNLCYYSIKECKRLILLEHVALRRATLHECSESTKPHVFQINVKQVGKERDTDTHTFACNSADEMIMWITTLQNVIKLEADATVRLGHKLNVGIANFKLTVKNKRMKLKGDGADGLDGFEPVFKAKLWKVKGGGDKRNPDHWYEREMWLSRNRNLVYYSPKEEMPLVYYTSADVARAEVRLIPDEESCKPFAFQFILPPLGSVEFSHGEFAANSEEMREKWIKAIKSAFVVDI